jgi:hypothetical protein
MNVIVSGTQFLRWAFFARWMRTTPDPRLHFMRNVLAHAGRPGGCEIAFLT